MSANNDFDLIVEKELESMLDRCQAAGVPREYAKAHVGFNLFSESLDKSIASKKAEALKKSETPAGLAMEKARALAKEAELSRSCKKSPEFAKACEDWLLLEKGISVGDTVAVYGWAKPREIILDEFSLSFTLGDMDSEPFMWFEGTCIRNRPSNRDSTSHGCPMDSRVYKV